MRGRAGPLVPLFFTDKTYFTFNYTYLGKTALLFPGPANFLWYILLSQIGSKIIHCRILHWVKNPKYSTLETSKSYSNALSQSCQKIYTIKHSTEIKDALLHSVRVCWVVKTRTLTSERNKEVRIKHLCSLKYFTGLYLISVKFPGLKFQQSSIFWKKPVCRELLICVTAYSI